MGSDISPPRRESALSKARHLGSAKSGTAHWWRQRVSAMVLVFLGIWFLYSILTQNFTNFSQSILWLQSPLNLMLITLTITISWYHGYLGLSVVMEDYIHHPIIKFFLLLSLKLGVLGLNVAVIYALIKIQFIPVTQHQGILNTVMENLF